MKKQQQASATSPSSATTIAFLSASAATTHEVAWSRFLGGVVGNTAWGIGLALAVFMLGMGLGALIARAAIRRLVHPRRAYVVAELVIASGALVADAALLYGGPVSRFLHAGAAAALTVDVFYSGVLILLPALAIGATYPLLIASIVRASRDAPQVTTLYRSGLAGGVLGVIVASLVLAPSIGFDGAAVVAAGANILAAILAWLLLPIGTSLAAPAGGSRPTHHLGEAGLLFTATACIGLGAQSVWNRVVVCYSGVSTFSFALIVAVYLLAQSIGFAVSRSRTPKEASRLAWWSLSMAAPVAMVSFAPLTWIAAIIPARDTAPFGWLVGCVVAVAAAVGPTAFLLGMAQAGALRIIEVGERDWASAVAWVSGIGTVASAVVALAGALFLIPVLGPRITIAVLGGGAAVSLLILHQRRLALAGVVAVAMVLLVRPGPVNFLGPEYDRAPVLYAEHGVQDTTAVILHDLPTEPHIRRLVANGMSYSGDSLYAQRYMRLLGHLPALAARGEDRALVICVGTGSTASSLLAYRYKQIDAVDISPSIRNTLGFFRHVNLGFERDPRIQLIVDDGDRFLRVAPSGTRYDVITLEPPPPRAPGATTLYSREFYLAARAHLAKGGVFAQWLPLHDLSAWEARTLIRTFLDVFPDATLQLAERNESILLGGLEGSHLNVSDDQRLTLVTVAADLARIGMEDQRPLEETLVADAETLQRLAGSGPILRFAWPAPELSPFAGPAGDQTIDAFAMEMERPSVIG